MRGCRAEAFVSRFFLVPKSTPHARHPKSPNLRQFWQDFLTSFSVAAFGFQIVRRSTRLVSLPLLFWELVATLPREHPFSDLDVPGQNSSPDPLCTRSPDSSKLQNTISKGMLKRSSWTSKQIIIMKETGYACNSLPPGADVVLCHVPVNKMIMQGLLFCSKVEDHDNVSDCDEGSPSSFDSDRLIHKVVWSVSRYL